MLGDTVVATSLGEDERVPVGVPLKVIGIELPEDSDPDRWRGCPDSFRESKTGFYVVEILIRKGDTLESVPGFIDFGNGEKFNPETSSQNIDVGYEMMDDYEDDTYWPADGSRYGLDPQRAQVNGTFYIDCVLGEIHFSSNLAGRTIVIDYLSDSLATDGEHRVHKFAEEAMYKCIIHAMVSTRANIQEYVVRRYKQDKFAAVRTAKLRLSNIKLEEITQALRGKSKQIKH